MIAAAAWGAAEQLTTAKPRCYHVLPIRVNPDFSMPKMDGKNSKLHMRKPFWAGTWLGSYTQPHMHHTGAGTHSLLLVNQINLFTGVQHSNLICLHTFETLHPDVWRLMFFLFKASETCDISWIKQCFAHNFPPDCKWASQHIISQQIRAELFSHCHLTNISLFSRVSLNLMTASLTSYFQLLL